MLHDASDSLADERDPAEPAELYQQGAPASAGRYASGWTLFVWTLTILLDECSPAEPAELNKLGAPATAGRSARCSRFASAELNEAGA